MAKHNDMPELNSAKVFSTILFTKEHLKPYCQSLFNTGNNIHPNRRTGQPCLQGSLRYRFKSKGQQTKQPHLTAPGRFAPAAVLPGNSGMNGCTIGAFGRNCPRLNNELTNFVKNTLRLPA